VPQSFAQLYTHLVFSTKLRKPYLRDTELRDSLHAYLVGACRNLGSPSLIVGGVEDHVHVLCRLSKTKSISELIRDLKRESSKWVKDTNTQLGMFQWQGGYGAFSISPSHVSELTRYISNQAQHHQTESFQDEFRRLCRKYGLEIDERYVWD
jgi:putative transposase